MVASNGTGYAYEDDEGFDDYDSEMDYDGEGFGFFAGDSEGGEGGYDPELYSDDEAFYEAMEAKVKAAKKNKGKAPTATAATTTAAKKATAQQAKANGRGNRVCASGSTGKRVPGTDMKCAFWRRAYDRDTGWTVEAERGTDLG